MIIKKVLKRKYDGVLYLIIPKYNEIIKAGDYVQVIKVEGKEKDD